MASIDFPNSPVVGDIFTAGNSSYRWTGEAWVSNNLGQIAWDDVTDKPLTFEPSAHTHAISDVTALQTALDGKAALVHTHVKADITDFAHTHVKADITDFAHTHVKADITDFAHTHVKADITDFAHTHAISDVTGLGGALDAKQDVAAAVSTKTANYTLAVGDTNDLVQVNGTYTITVPASTFATGTRVDVANIGTGTVTFAGSGLTLQSKDSKVTVNKQYAAATLFFTSATTALLVGDLA